MKRFKAGQTVYIVNDDFCDHYDFTKPLHHWVDSYHVTNQPAPREGQIAFFDGRVSRHYFDELIKRNRGHLLHGRVTRSRRTAMRWAKVFNQTQATRGDHRTALLIS